MTDTIDIAKSIQSTELDQIRKFAHVKGNLESVVALGATPLHYAIYIDNGTVVEFLLSLGANPNVIQPDGLTPLAVAAYRGKTAIIETLIRCGADIKQKSRGITPIQWAAQEGNTSAICVLINAGADPNTAGDDGSTPLGVASASGYLDTVRELLRNGASTAEQFGESALLSACAFGRTEVAQLLIDYGALINIRDGVGNTPLHYAVRSQNVELLQILLKHGGDPSITDKRGLNAQALADKVKSKKLRQSMNDAFNLYRQTF
jgi:ankyrin